MRESQIGILFGQFLLTKGYPQGSLLYEVPLRIAGEGVFRPDLVILDVNNKQYIALIEFKSKVDKRVEVNTLGQFYKYFSLLGTSSLPAYLVFSITDDDFQILALAKDKKFEPVSKEDFPDFEALSARRLVEEKIEQRQVEEKTLIELKQKKSRAKQSSYFSILSLIIGVLTAVGAIFLQQKELGKSPSRLSILHVDSLNIKYQSLRKKTFELEKMLNSINKSSSKADTIFMNYDVRKFEKRISIIEKGISDNPEKTLSLIQIRQEMKLLEKSNEFLKELNQAKLDALKNEMEIQNAWILGSIIAIFGAILSFALPNLLTKVSSASKDIEI